MKTLPLAEVKAHLSALVSEIEAQHEQVTVTKNGAPAAVVISVHEWESLLETIAVLSDQQTVADLAEAQRTRAAGETYGTDDVLAAFEARRSAGA
ncbi:type II toxin-antitoxin system Phd/YefM family antitoxin [Allokutzneria multivorans]